MTGRVDANFTLSNIDASVSVAYNLNLRDGGRGRKAAKQVALSPGASGAFLIVVTPLLSKCHNADRLRRP